MSGNERVNCGYVTLRVSCIQYSRIQAMPGNQAVQKASPTRNRIYCSVHMHITHTNTRDGIFKLLRSPGKIDTKEAILPAYVAWRAGTTNLFLLGS
jgi:hypothetical protein